MAPGKHSEQDEPFPFGREETPLGDANEETSEEAEDSVAAEEGEALEAPAERLNLDVQIEATSPCERHVVVRVSREDIDRYFDREFSELATTAHVRGFRPGRAPRRLIEARFRKEVKDKVKASLLADSLTQLSQEYELAPISQPELNLDAVELPDEGPMTYEFNLEVRPDFELPQWRGLHIECPVREFTSEDVDRALQALLAQYGTLVPHDGPAEVGDYIATRLTFTFEGETLGRSDEELIRIRPVLSFRDGKIERFDELMRGVRAGEVRVGAAEVSPEAPNERLRGRTVTATFEVKEVKKLKLPELTREFLRSLGDFETEGDLRDLIYEKLTRQLEYEQRRAVRRQVLQALTASVDWVLPPKLVERQTERELERAILELRSAGFPPEEIRIRENALRRQSFRVAAQAIKEHFILEKLAEVEGIEVSEAELDAEIAAIADNIGQTPRRVRARLEKAGRMDVIGNQVLERKALDLILSHATFTEVPYQPAVLEEEALERSVAGEPAPAAPTPVA